MSSTTRRPLFVAATVITVLGAALAGCSTETGSGSGSDSSSGEEQVLSVATNGGAALLETIPAFEEANPGVKIDVKDYPQNYREVIGTQLTGGNAPDIIQIPPGGGNNISVKVAGAQGYYEDLSDAAWAGDVPEAAAEQLTTDEGALVAVPMILASIGGIYNQGAVDAAGLTIPETWSEVLQFCQDAQAAGKVAYGLGLSDTWTTQMVPYALTSTLVYGPNPEFITEQIAGSATFADSEWGTAFDKYLEMDEQGCFNANPNGTPYSQVQDAIREGDTLATVSVASETASIASTGPSDLELTYAAFPATDDPADTFLPTSVGPAFGINADSSNKDLAATFLEYLATADAQITYATAFGDVAAMPGDLTQESQVAEVVQEFTTQQKITTFPDRLWPSTTVQPEMFDGVQSLFSGQSTVEDVLANMDNAFSAN